MLDRSSIMPYICAMANKLSTEKQVQILNLLVEGSSLRSISRVCDCSINTVTKLLVEVGRACEALHEQTVVGVKSERVQCDEIWSFVYSKEKNANDDMPTKAGDVWTWTALDADTKLIISWLAADRSAESANEFMMDVASRLVNRVQLTTDGHKPYLRAVDNAFGNDIDFAQLVKIYGQSSGENATERKYSPAECTGAIKTVVTGNPREKFISTSYVERQNLTMRMSNRRFTRLTNAFSKKLENHCFAIALHFVYYNFVRIHKSLRVTPAMQAGLIKRPMTLTDLVNLTDAYSATGKKRGEYKKNDDK